MLIPRRSSSVLQNQAGQSSLESGSRGLQQSTASAGSTTTPSGPGDTAGAGGAIAGSASTGAIPGKGAGVGTVAKPEVCPIGPENVLLRGCKLSSCAHVVGFVLFTGDDTKLMRNQRQPPSKVSNVYAQLNRLIFLIFLVQFVLIVISTIAFFLYSRRATELSEGDKIGYWYLESVLEGGGASSAVSFITFLILYNNLVPISLYVSLDVIKVTQAKQIELDRAMAYDPAEDDPYLAIERRKKFGMRNRG